MDAFAFEPSADLVPARSGSGHSSLSASAGDIGLDLDALHIDTVIWLRFVPRAYLRDWVAGWLDVLLNGPAGRARQGSRASLGDFFRSCASLIQPPVLTRRQVEALRSHLRVVELSSPEQAHFWLYIQSERARETLQRLA